MLTEWEKSHKEEILWAWDYLVEDFELEHRGVNVDGFNYGWSIGVLSSFDLAFPVSEAG